MVDKWFIFWSYSNQTKKKCNMFCPVWNDSHVQTGLSNTINIHFPKRIIFNGWKCSLARSPAALQNVFVYLFPSFEIEEALMNVRYHTESQPPSDWETWTLNFHSLQLYINSSQKDSSKRVSLTPIRCIGSVHDEIANDFQKTNDNEATKQTENTGNK